MNILREKPDLTKYIHKFQSQFWIGCIGSMCGWRQTMQDTDICEPNIQNQKISVFAIFDGHGGAEVAIFTKKHFVQELVNNVNFKNKNYQQALLQTFPKMDELMISETGSQQLFDIKQALDKQINQSQDFSSQQEDQIICIAGTTALVCLITQEDIYIANLGDSRCIISYQNQCKQFTIEHKPYLPEQKKRIQKAGGKIKNNRVNGKLAISRSIGDFEFKVKKNLKSHQQMVISIPQIHKIKNQNINYIMMGCDGVWQGKQITWYSQFLQKALNQKNFPDHAKIIQQIFNQVVADNQNGDDGHDNMTSILIVPKKINKTLVV